MTPLISCPLKKLQKLPVLELKRFVRLQTAVFYQVTGLLPDKENLILQLFKRCAILLLMVRKGSEQTVTRISCTLGSHRRNKWMTLFDKLKRSKDTLPNTLHLQFFKMLVLESTSNVKGLRPFWTPAYMELSEQLSLPIGTDFVASDSTSWSPLLAKQEEKLSCLTIQKTKLPNRNSLMIYSPSSTYTVVDKWDEENTAKGSESCVKLAIKPTQAQKKILTEWFQTCNYIYNKGIDLVENGSVKCNAQQLRDKLVTKVTQKNEEYKNLMAQLVTIKRIRGNPRATPQLICMLENTEKHLRMRKKNIPRTTNDEIEAWQLRTPKEVRYNALRDLVQGYKTNFDLIKSGKRKFFVMKHRKAFDMKSMKFEKNQLKQLTTTHVQIMPEFMEQFGPNLSQFRVTKRSISNVEKITNVRSFRLVRKRNKYFLHFTVEKTDANPLSKVMLNRMCGIDPGVRDFATVFDGDGLVTEIKHPQMECLRINEQMKRIKNRRPETRRKVAHGYTHFEQPRRGYKSRRFKRTRKGCRKRQLMKREARKENLITETHWQTIQYLTQNYDVIFFGDIKSHDIVRRGKNKRLNADMNELRFHKYKTRLEQKAKQRGKLAFKINEAYTTKTCSSCGKLSNPGSKKEYHCFNLEGCNAEFGRDVNAAKNILMKGFTEQKLHSSLIAQTA